MYQGSGLDQRYGVEMECTWNDCDFGCMVLLVRNAFVCWQHLEGNDNIEAFKA